MQKKSMPCLIKNASICVADCMPKTTMFLIFHFLWNTKILQENHVYLLLHWFSGGNCFIRSSYRRCSISKGVLKVQKIHRKTPGQNLFFNKFAGTADILTWKSLNILYRKLMKFLKVYLKKILRVHVKVSLATVL